MSLNAFSASLESIDRRELTKPSILPLSRPSRSNRTVQRGVRRHLLHAQPCGPKNWSTPGRARLFGWCDQSGACPDCVKFTDTLMDQFATYPQSEAEVRSSAPFGEIPPFVLEHDPG